MHKLRLLVNIFLVFIIMSDDRVKCLVCNKSFKNEANRITHHNKFHDIVNVNNENSNDDVMYSSYNENINTDKVIPKCLLCEKKNHTYANVKTLNNHIKKYHPNHEIDVNFVNNINNNKEKDPNDRILLEFLNDYNIEDSILSDSIIENDIAINNDIYSFKNHVSTSLKNSNNFVILLLILILITINIPI